MATFESQLALTKPNVLGSISHYFLSLILNSTELDSIQLSVFSHRFMSIAEQMGKTLQRTSISTNIKERLDFSCALFGVLYTISIYIY